MNSKIEAAFRKYEQGGLLNKLQFKCAFIYLTGMSPSKQDMQLVKTYIASDFAM